MKRVLGAEAGNTVFALDAVKGAAAVGWPIPFIAGEFLVPAQLAGLLGALLGHSFSCFTRFKGGKGVATGAGGLLVLLPVATLIAGAVWVVTFYASRYVSLASLIAALVLPGAAWSLGASRVLVGFAALIAVFVVVRHRANIQRLLNGTENRFSRKKEPGADPKA